jgi:phosphatidylserine/phosphatidylglycerophosphate/cardiolipin synthase-like enzyme
MSRNIFLTLCLSLLALPAARAENAPRLRELANQVLAPMGGEGRAWQLTAGNKLPPGWIVQTSDAHPGQEFLATAFDAVDQAQSTVDFVLLGPEPDGDFLARFTASMTRLAHSGRPITVRILFGQYGLGNMNIDAFVRTITRHAGGSPLTVKVGALQTCAGLCNGLLTWSFNHSKIVVVDDRVAVVGGHNLFTNAYLRQDPIFELSMKLEGPAAQAASNFANDLWQYTCAYNFHGLLWKTYASTWYGRDRRIAPYECSYYEPAAAPAPAGDVAVLGIGRLGWGWDPRVDIQRQWSEAAMEHLFATARTTIRLSQQDVAFTKIGGNFAWNGPVWNRLADFLLRGGHVYLLLTNKDARSIDNVEYSWGVSAQDVARMVKGIADTRAGRDTTAEVCERFHVAAVARPTGPDGASQTWPSGRPIGNHAKSYLVDDQVVYIGSHNLYPTTWLTTGSINFPFLQGSLQEYGYLIEDAEAGRQYLAQYWNPLWTAARRFAVSGNDAPSCSLRP